MLEPALQPRDHRLEQLQVELRELVQQRLELEQPLLLQGAVLAQMLGHREVLLQDLLPREVLEHRFVLAALVEVEQHQALVLRLV